MPGSTRNAIEYSPSFRPAANTVDTTTRVNQRAVELPVAPAHDTDDGQNQSRQSHRKHGLPVIVVPRIIVGPPQRERTQELEEIGGVQPITIHLLQRDLTRLQQPRLNRQLRQECDRTKAEADSKQPSPDQDPRRSGPDRTPSRPNHLQRVDHDPSRERQHEVIPLLRMARQERQRQHQREHPAADETPAGSVRDSWPRTPRDTSTPPRRAGNALQMYAQSNTATPGNTPRRRPKPVVPGRATASADTRRHHPKAGGRPSTIPARSASPTTTRARPAGRTAPLAGCLQAAFPRSPSHPNAAACHSRGSDRRCNRIGAERPTLRRCRSLANPLGRHDRRSAAPGPRSASRAPHRADESTRPTQLAGPITAPRFQASDASVSNSAIHRRSQRTDFGSMRLDDPACGLVAAFPRLQRSIKSKYASRCAPSDHGPIRIANPAVASRASADRHEPSA